MYRMGSSLRSPGGNALRADYLSWQGRQLEQAAPLLLMASAYTVGRGDTLNGLHMLPPEVRTAIHDISNCALAPSISPAAAIPAS